MENPLERPNYYAIIPADVRYADINANAKLLYGEITALANKTGTCWASNKYFAELYKVRSEAISRWIGELEAAGFVSTKINKTAGNKRYIRITDVPIAKNRNSYSEKSQVNNNTNKNSINVDLTKDLLSLVNKVLSREFRVLPERGVKKTLDAFSLVEIEMALTALAQDKWHAPKLKELKLDYFIRSTTIDKFLAIAKKDGVVPADEGVEDPIIAKGDGTFPAKWPEGKPEYRTDYGENNEREDRYFRGVKIDHKTLAEYQRIMAERG